jgi:hypothetical protein
MSSTCEYCGKPTFGGVSSNGDPYGQGKDIPTVRPWRFSCWKCYESKGRAADEERAAEIDAAFMAAGRCAFIRAYVGRCGDPMPCAKHVIRCSSCGAPATHECDASGSLVCGMPLCNDCEHGKCDPDNPGFFFGLGGGHVRKSLEGAVA